MIKTSSGTVYYTQQEVNNKVNEVMEDGYRITNAIYEEAYERNWCSDYDEWAKNVNESLKFFEIPLTRKEYDVVYTITRTQEAEVIVKVTSRNKDDAENEANEMYSTYELADKVKEYDWDTQDVNIDSTEVEEA